jgi:hypothetical protein
MSWEVIATPKHRGGKGKQNHNSIVVTHEKPSGGSKIPSICIRVGSSVAKKMRWQKGDVVVVVRDGDAVGIRRIPGKSGHGWTLSQASDTATMRVQLVSAELLAVLLPCEIADPLISDDVVVIGEAKQ